MGDVVNLRRARKAKARSLSEKTASANRLAHGRSKAEKITSRTEQERADRLLDGAKRE